MPMIVMHDSCFAAALKVSLQQMRKCTQRDFFRWMRLPITISNLKVPLLLDATRSDQLQNKPQESLESVSFVLPSDLLCALHEAGPQALRGSNFQVFDR